MAFDLDDLPSITVGDGGDVITHITHHHAETAGEVNKLQQVTIDGNWKDRLYDSLQRNRCQKTHQPARNDSTVHRGLHPRVAHHFKALAFVPNDGTERLDGTCSNGYAEGEGDLNMSTDQVCTFK